MSCSNEPAIDPEKFQILLNRLLSSNNEERQQAEVVLKELRKSPNNFVLALITALRNPQTSEQARLMCCVILRPAIIKTDSVWPLLTPQTQETMKNELIHAVENERSSSVLRKIIDSVSDIGAYLSDKGGWVELLPFTLRLTTSHEPIHRESALNIFAQLAVLYGADVFRPHFALIKGVLQTGLSDTATLKVRLAALVATCSFLQIMEKQDDAHLNQFRTLLPLMMECITVAIQQKQETEAQMALEIFVEITETASAFFKPFLPVVANTMFAITQARELKDETRRYGFEMLISLCEARPALMKKVPNFVPTIIKLILSWMITIEDDQDWYQFKDADELSDNAIAEQALDRLCLALHGKAIVPELFGHLNELITSADWRHRYSAVQAMALCGEGCQKVLENHLDEIIKNISALANDQHPRVRWAVVNCVGQMCNDFGPKVQDSFAGQIVPIILRAMNDSVQVVQGHGVTCIINFVCSAEPEVSITHLNAFLNAIRLILQSPSLKVQENAITAIASIADHVNQAFAPYYDYFVPYLKQVVQKAKDKQYRMLRGKVMEALSLIGVAVGKEIFAKDAVEVMTEMMNTQVVEADDPQIGFLETSFARLAECLEADFVPFLPVVMPSALERAAMKADIQVFDATSNKPKDGWDVLSFGDKIIGVHTSQLEEKASAMHTLACYAANLGSGFYPYVQRVTEIALSHLAFYLNEGVREAAYSSLPFLIKSIIDCVKTGTSNKEFLQTIWNAMFDQVSKVLPEEPDQEVKLNSLTAFNECFVCLGQPCLDTDQLREVAEMFKTMLNEWMARKDEVVARTKQDDYDDEEAEKVAKSESIAVQVLEAISDLVGRVARIHGESFFPAFQEFLQPVIIAMIATTRSEEERQRGICIYDDLIESSNTAAVNYMGIYLPAMMQYATDKSEAIRQASVYGLGVASIALGERFVPVVNQVLNKLREVITTPGAFEGEAGHPTENAISSMARIVLSQSTHINVNEVVSFITSLLPLHTDSVEARACHDNFLIFIEKYPNAVFGEGFVNVQHVIKVFAKVLNTRFLSNSAVPRVAALLHQLNNQFPNAFTSLPSDVAPIVQEFLSKN